MSELPEFVTSLRVSRSLVKQTKGALEPFRLARIEGCVLWFGIVHASGVCEVRDVIRPEQHGRPQNYSITAEAMRAVRKSVRPRELMLLTQIHTHPRKAFFSEWDALNALNKQKGALNLIVPDFGEVAWVDPARFCMVECDGSGDWREWRANDWSRLEIYGD